MSTTRLIGIDLDNTIVCYDTIFHRMAVGHDLIPDEHPFDKRSIRDHIRRLSDGEREWQMLQRVVYGTGIEHAEPFDGMLDFLRRCKAHSIKVVIVSHKTRFAVSVDSGIDLRKAALAWMERQQLFSSPDIGLTADDVYFENSRDLKCSRVEQLGCSHFIDDLDETFLSETFPDGVTKILFSPHGYQSARDDVIGYAAWSEISDCLFDPQSPCNTGTGSAPTAGSGAAIVSNNRIALDERSKEIRRMIVRMLAAARRGHLASALSIVEILRVLYDEVLRFDPEQPESPDRDRFILSKGQGCMALYVVLAEKGFFPESELWKFCQADGKLGGHPEIWIPGVEATTGSLGHGFAIGIGMAINAKYNELDYHTYVLIGDGEANEGAIWESALCAGKHGLSNLTLIVDYNKQQSYGTTCEVLDLEPLRAKLESFGLAVREVDGHDVPALRAAFSALPLKSDRPSALICHTVKGKGIKGVDQNLAWHHKSNVTDDEIAQLLASIGKY